VIEFKDRRLIFSPGPTPNTVRAADGSILPAPEGWILLPPGDAALTRRLKAAGDHWVVLEKKGRKGFSKGVWAPAATIDRIRGELEAERSTESFAKRKEADARRRDQAQAEYVEDFFGAVVAFLAFHPNYAELADRLARAVIDHATPGRQRHRRPHAAQPGRAAGRGGGDRLAVRPDDRLRWHGDSQDQGETSRSSSDAGRALSGVASPLPSWGASARRMSTEEGVGGSSSYYLPGGILKLGTDFSFGKANGRVKGE